MSRISLFVRIGWVFLVGCVATAWLPRRAAEAQQASKPSVPARAKAPATAAPSSRQTARNLGKAYYEQSKYLEAILEFQKVIKSGQAVATDYLNLGLALMHANALDGALSALTTAKKMNPKLVAADYCLGILYKRQLRYPDAEAILKRVTEADPNEPAAWFNLGTVYFAQREFENALDAHQHVFRMGFGRAQNFYVASVFHSFTNLVRMKRMEEAQKFLKIHEKVRDRVPGISLQSPALEGGKYGQIIVAPSRPVVAAARRPRAPLAFSDVTARLGVSLAAGASPPDAEAVRDIKAADYSLEYARRTLVPLLGGSVALGDYNADGPTDLYVANPTGTNRLLRAGVGGAFADVTSEVALADPGASLSATFADYDNSGHLSLFVAGLGGVRLYRNTGSGAFEDQTEKAGLQGSPSELATRAVLFDADHDGLLDLIVTHYTDLSVAPSKPSFAFPEDFSGARLRFYRNKGDGAFTDITASSGLGSETGRWRGAVFADFDNDGYADLLVTRDDATPLLYLNQGEGKFVNRTAQAGAALTQAVALDAQASDLDHDGNFDLVLWTPSDYRVLLNQGNARFEPAKTLPAVSPPASTFAFRGLVTDLDGDSFDDLLAADSGGRRHFIVNRAGKFEEAPLTWPAEATGVASLAPAWLTTPGKLALIGLTPSGHLAAFEKLGPPARWIEVKLAGFKSNTQGVGSTVELKAGNFYRKVFATGGAVRVYTGSLARLDVVRVTWPNQVIQNWTAVATNKPLEVRESERLSSSCPFLYIWNGERFVFHTDVLGTAPIGELLPDGGRIKPYPEELVRLPDSMRDQDGMYVFQLTDELREVDYFDQVRLLAVDHPETEEIYANEIYSSAPTTPALSAVGRKRLPVSAVDEHGHDVLPLVSKRDGEYPSDFRRHRILGLADLHSLTLDLGDVAASGPLSLWLDGWVYWTDSNAHRALMDNSSLQLIPPYLQVRDAKGEWVTVLPDMGVPSGTNRTMRVDLAGKFLSADRRIRIGTNFCVFWDQVFFTADERVGPAPVELPLVSADLHYRGFATPVSDPAHLKPDYFEYASLLDEAPWDPMFGRYTRYGEVDKLLTHADDRMAVMATGDELTVTFSGRELPPLKSGWKRSFFLYTHGWAKDGEPNTAYSKTVEPLPFRQMSNYPYASPERYPDTPEYRRYLDEYQTRPRWVLIPSLAPPIALPWERGHPAR